MPHYNSSLHSQATPRFYLAVGRTTLLLHFGVLVVSSFVSRPLPFFAKICEWPEYEAIVSINRWFTSKFLSH